MQWRVFRDSSRLDSNCKIVEFNKIRYFVDYFFLSRRGGIFEKWAEAVLYYYTGSWVDPIQLKITMA